MSIKVFLKKRDDEDDIVLPNWGAPGDIFGAAGGFEQVNLNFDYYNLSAFANKSVNIDQNIEKVVLQGYIDQYQFSANGNQVTISRDGFTLANIIVQDDEDGTVFGYHHGMYGSYYEAAFKIETTATGFQVKLEDQVLTSTPAVMEDLPSSPSQPLNPNDDYAGDSSTTGVLAVGETIQASHEVASDSDWFKVTLEADKIYQVQVTGFGDNPITAGAGISLYNDESTFIGGGSSTNIGSSISTSYYRVDETNDYFIDVRGGWHGSDYQVSLSEYFDTPLNITATATLDYTLVSPGTLIDFSSWDDASLYISSKTDIIVTAGTDQASFKLGDNGLAGYYTGGSSPIEINSQVFVDGYKDSESGLFKLNLAEQTTTYVGNLPSNYSNNYNFNFEIPNAEGYFVAHSTQPYGRELYKASFDDNRELQFELIKDINSGAQGSFSWPYNGPTDGAQLPNGKIVFPANDGVHGDEPWVSDGTAEGTFMLGNLLSWTGSSPQQFTAFKDWVVFNAMVWNDDFGNLGRELVFTDGTAEGTFAMDINPGGSPSNPAILGAVGDHLFFTATAHNAEGVESKGIYKTNGTDFEKLATILNDATLLGWSDTIAYFNVSDSTHGNELWAADLVGDKGFYLVKDILPGTGASLTGDIGAQMLGDQLLFKAYVNDTAQAWMLSDGTEEGTIQLVNTQQVKGFGDWQQGQIDADSDQVFYLSTPNDLIVIDLEGNATTLASDILSFNLLDENALLIEKQDALWISDGTVDGTVSLIEDVTNYRYFDEGVIYATQSTEDNREALWYSEGTIDTTQQIGLINGSLNLNSAVIVPTDSWFIG
ncbi:hypothetical protein JX580_09235 [Thiomicrospira microaerophila]|uniref:hypothetical protein n=1 Tax=Thiomicrospira microaerophila TaxID=406020 RepID=UPI00200CC3E9|nr:hypothetical protein [Thiomicrospira microaerophila]UQB41842.1 hypothetical protein JX580_09235 [Thiomicrospira microaerophila]